MRNSSSGGTESETVRWRKLRWWGLKEGEVRDQTKAFEGRILQRSHYGAYS